MKQSQYISGNALFLVIVFAMYEPVRAQDKIYLGTGEIINGKVVEVWAQQIIYTDSATNESHTLKLHEIDAIAYADGHKEDFPARHFRKRILINNKASRLNTLAFGMDIFGCSLNYERRLKNEKVGFRIPFYVGYFGGGMAGNGTFNLKQGGHLLRDVTYFPNTQTDTYINDWGGSFAIGFNPRFYFARHKKIRGFAGPEITIGVIKLVVQDTHNTDTVYWGNYYNNGETTNTIVKFYGLGSFEGLVGISINLRRAFNIAVQAGVGIGDIFGSPNPIGWTGTWRFGISLGGNF